MNSIQNYGMTNYQLGFGRRALEKSINSELMLKKLIPQRKEEVELVTTTAAKDLMNRMMMSLHLTPQMTKRCQLIKEITSMVKKATGEDLLEIEKAISDITHKS